MLHHVSGLYNTKHNLFFRFEDRGSRWDAQVAARNAAYERTRRTWLGAAEAPTRLDVAMNYFPHAFPDHLTGTSPRDIPTPELDCIFRRQQLHFRRCFRSADLERAAPPRDEDDEEEVDDEGDADEPDPSDHEASDEEAAPKRRRLARRRREPRNAADDDLRPGELYSTVEFVYGLLGRMLYEKGSLDGWHRIPFFLGMAGSGKSTICNMLSKIFPRHMVGSVGQEDTFMLASLYDKAIWMCTEVKKETPKFFVRNQDEFQNICSGDYVSIAIKYKDAKTVPWTVPGILCGNELFNVVDASGSILRRMCMIEFNHLIPATELDMELEQKIARRLPYILLKMNMQYLMIAERYGREDMSLAWSPQLQEFQSNLSFSVDLPSRFLRDRNTVDLKTFRDLDLDSQEEIYIKWTEFTGIYLRWHDLNGISRKAVDQSHFKRIFHGFELYITEDTRPYEDNPAVSATWVVGIGIPSNFDNA